MVSVDEARKALSERWQTTTEIAEAIPRRSTFYIRRQQVYCALRRLVEDGEAQRESAGKDTIWRRI